MASSTQQHNITGDFIINNSEDIRNDYKSSNHRRDAKDPDDRVDDDGKMLFRLLIPGPANIRGRVEAYKMSQGGSK